jgi:hypothetical protein
LDEDNRPHAVKPNEALLDRDKVVSRDEELNMNICPIPLRWNEIYEALLSACKEKRIASSPPVPLILSGWVYSNDVEKAETWKATESWAQENGLTEHVVVPEGDWYAVEHPYIGAVGPFGAPMYLPWKFKPEPIPSAANIEAALKRLIEAWGDVAGELNHCTRPYRITGAKARRLVVLVLPSASLPPWGDWKSLPKDDSRRTFTKLRQAINRATAPLEIDHVEFEIEDSVATDSSNLSNTHSIRQR